MMTSQFYSSKYFSETYNEARNKFCDAAKAANAKLETIELYSQNCPNNSLYTDIAWLGNSKPHNVILHSSGLHGVEGFAGSAIQTCLLKNLPVLRDEDALILVHCLNPYGMINLRRVNASNVDLNRNFLFSSDEYSGSPNIYSKINSLINPDSPPVFDLFFLRALAIILKYGFVAVKQAVANGQYDFPKGLFFGGIELQEELVNYKEWLLKNLPLVKNICVIDVHTGLGRFADDLLLIEENCSHSDLEKLQKHFGKERIKTLNPNKSIAYSIKGSISEAIPQLLNQAKVNLLTQEFGTVSPISVLFALREENRNYYYSKNDQSYSSVKTRLKEAFYPSSNIWRKKVLLKGVQLVHQSTKFIF